jgi:adenylylsulfate kinase
MRPAFAAWLTGLPASGKSTIARALVEELARRGIDIAVLESDALRPILAPHAGYGDADRDVFYGALVHVGALLVDHGVPVLFDATANRAAYRARAKSQIGRSVEIFVDTPLDVCVFRDPKGLYRQARSGASDSMPGVQAEYERPARPDLVVSGSRESPEASARAIVRLLEARGWLAGAFSF